MQDTIQTELDQLVAQTKGRFFSIRFIKKDGSVRVVNGKDKYQHLLAGGKSTVKPAGYTAFIDRNANGGIGSWKSAKASSLIEFQCGEIHKVAKVG